MGTCNTTAMRSKVWNGCCEAAHLSLLRRQCLELLLKLRLPASHGSPSLALLAQLLVRHLCLTGRLLFSAVSQLSCLAMPEQHASSICKPGQEPAALGKHAVSSLQSASSAVLQCRQTMRHEIASPAEV